MTTMNRRSFLKRTAGLAVGGLSAGGLALPSLLRAEAQNGILNSKKSVIMIYLCGAPPHQDMWDLKMDAPSDIRGPYKPIATNVDGIQISEHSPRLAKMMDKLVPIRSMYGSLDGAHDSFICYTGRAPSAKPAPARGWPSLGSTVSKLMGAKNPSMPAFVGLAPNAGHPPYGSPGHPGFMGPTYAAFRPNGSGTNDLRLEGVTLDRLNERADLLRQLDRLRRDVDAGGAVDAMDAFQQQAVNVLTSNKLIDALDVSKEPQAIRERYGQGQTANYGDGAPLNLEHFLLARRMVEAGARVVTLNFGRWDFHDSNYPQLLKHLPLFDQGMSALVQDLSDRGMLDDTAIVAWGEFGRTPTINKEGGRDHWPRVGGALLAGGGFRTGQVIGATDRQGGEIADRGVHFGEVFASLYKFLGFDLATTALTDLSGRPQRLVDDWKALPELA